MWWPYRRQSEFPPPSCGLTQDLERRRAAPSASAVGGRERGSRAGHRRERTWLLPLRKSPSAPRVSFPSTSCCSPPATCAGSRPAFQSTGSPLTLPDARYGYGATPRRVICLPLVVSRRSFIAVPNTLADGDESHRRDFVYRRSEIRFDLVVLSAATGIVQLHHELPSTIGPNVRRAVRNVRLYPESRFVLTEEEAFEYPAR